MTDSLRALIREHPDRNRCDLTRLLASPEAFAALVARLAAPWLDRRISVVAGLDAMGFVLAGAVARKLGVGVVLLRKGGKGAWDTHAESFRDYSGQEKSLEVSVDAFDESDVVLIVDDWSETGTQLAAAAELVRRSGAQVAGAAVVAADPEARARSASADLELSIVLP